MARKKNLTEPEACKVQQCRWDDRGTDYCGRPRCDHPSGTPVGCLIEEYVQRAQVLIGQQQ